MLNVPVSAAASWLGGSWKRHSSHQSFFNLNSDQGELDPSVVIPLPGVRQQTRLKTLLAKAHGQFNNQVCASEPSHFCIYIFYNTCFSSFFKNPVLDIHWLHELYSYKHFLQLFFNLFFQFSFTYFVNNISSKKSQQPHNITT